MMRSRLALLLTACLALLPPGCPEYQRPGCESPGAWRCSTADPTTALPEFCAPSRHWTPRGDEPCGRSGRVCVVAADGVASCSRRASAPVAGEGADGGAP